MHGTGPSQSYSTSAKLLHWGFIGVFAYGIFKQVDDLSQLEDPNFLRFEFIFACVFLALLALRLWIMRGQGSALPAAAPVWNRMAAKLVHFGMYVALMAIGVSGLAIGVVFTLGMRDGALMELCIAAHEASIAASYGLITLHVAAAVYRRVLGDGVWSVMVPIL
ncbi:MAG: cytochrome b, partial [Planktomarina sp.]